MGVYADVCVCSCPHYTQSTANRSSHLNQNCHLILLSTRQPDSSCPLVLWATVSTMYNSTSETIMLPYVLELLDRGRKCGAPNSRASGDCLVVVSIALSSASSSLGERLSLQCYACNERSDSRKYPQRTPPRLSEARVEPLLVITVTLCTAIWGCLVEHYQYLMVLTFQTVAVYSCGFLYYKEHSSPGI